MGQVEQKQADRPYDIVSLLGGSGARKATRFVAVAVRPSSMSCTPPSARSLRVNCTSTGLTHQRASLRTF